MWSKPRGCTLVMPRFPNEDDLFKESTMTFGEHLEELRTCLFKSLIALVIGFIVGLMVGGRVANFIQLPLSNALTTVSTVPGFIWLRLVDRRDGCQIGAMSSHLRETAVRQN